MTSCELFGHTYHEKTGKCWDCDRVLPGLPAARERMENMSGSWMDPAVFAVPAPAPALPEVIKLHYSTIDRYSESRRIKTLAGARAYAKRKLGDSFDLGGSYAVSYDGVAKLTANISLRLLLDAG